MISSREVVENYLDAFCPVAKKGGVAIHGHREENKAFMDKHELSFDDIQGFLADLRVEDYSSGPDDDDDDQRLGLCKIWFFGPDYCSIPLYVKLADWFKNHPKRHHCVSFKDASPALRLPYVR